MLDQLIERSTRRQIVCLKGNHEAFMLDVLEDPKKISDWRQYGGLPTLMSYGLRPSINPSPDEQNELVAGLRSAMPSSLTWPSR